jgi:hypothetical protein
MVVINTHRIEVPAITVNFTPFGLIFTAKKFVEAAKAVIAQESLEGAGWHPVGKYLACHSIELSLKAFLTLNGETLSGARDRFRHRLCDLLDETEKQNLRELVALTDEDQAEIRRAAPYYSGKVFEYPSVFEAVRAYPGDPDRSHLLNVAEKLIDALYYPCRSAA